MEQRIRILYIAFYFPPLGGVAALRSLKMVKYLQDYGIDCTVLCLHPWGIRNPRDRSLEKEIPQNTEVQRFFAVDLSWLYKLLWGFKLNGLVRWIDQDLMIPDNMILSLPLAWWKLQKIVKKDKFRLAVISAGPFSSLKLGLKLKSRYSLGYICDWRDEWTNNAQRVNSDYPPSSLIKEQRLEAQILSHCSAAVYLTEIMQANFLGQYPFLKNTPCRIIPNGFDEEDFSSFTAKPPSTKMRILYTGSFYDRIQPDALWKAVTEIAQEGKIVPGKIEIEIMGKNSPAFVYGAYAGNPNLRKMLRFSPFTSHRKCIRHMQAADLLLIYVPSGINSQSILTGKLFDYLRSGKPILAIAPLNGLIAGIVKTALTGFVAESSDIEGIKQQLKILYELWKRDQLSQIEADQDYISRFSRQKQAGELALLIHQVLNYEN